MSYRKTSQNPYATILFCTISLKLDRHPDNSAADVLDKFRSDAMIWITNLAASELLTIRLLFNVKTEPSWQNTSWVLSALNHFYPYDLRYFQLIKFSLWQWRLNATENQWWIPTAKNSSTRQVINHCQARAISDYRCKMPVEFRRWVYWTL